MVDPAFEDACMSQMVNTGMCTIILDELIARYPDGSPMLYGTFCVQHKDHLDRLIVDDRAPK